MALAVFKTVVLPNGGGWVQLPFTSATEEEFVARQCNELHGAKDSRRALASVSVLLDRPEIQQMVVTHSRPIVLDAIRDVLACFRGWLVPEADPPDIQTVIDGIRNKLGDIAMDRLRPVVNATGIILHTGLGRAVLPQAAVDALGSLNRCCNLQIDLATGLRGKRNYMTECLLTKLTGAEAAMVVNNNAAATHLILTALCKGKEVIISRGQLIEIGGSFRLPDCVHQSGAILVEVGTTNKTHLNDYGNAITENTGAIMRVNPSNYRIIGFTEEVPIADLVKLKQGHHLFVIDDLGCGALVNMEAYGLPHEPTVPESISAGADLVCFSGDKLIGGPQSGIIAGRKELIQRIRKHPLTRMLRVGKLTDTALERTLRLYLDPDSLPKNHPSLRMLTTDLDTLKRKATRMKRQLEKEGVELETRVKEHESAMGSGSLPAVPIKTYTLAVRSSKFSADRLCRLLRQNEPPVIARIYHDEVLLDMRTLLEDEDMVTADALRMIGQG